MGRESREVWLSRQVIVRLVIVLLVWNGVACGRGRASDVGAKREGTAAARNLAADAHLFDRKLGGTSGAQGGGGGGAAGAAGAGGAVVAVGVGEAGQADYARLCAPCHGLDLRGYVADHAPSLVNPTFLESASNEFLRVSIQSGRPGTSMGAYGSSLGGPLDDAALDKLVAFIRRRGPKAKALKAPAAGDATRGKDLYARACKTCHGDAQTRGEAVHLANAAFLKRASAAFINHAIVNGRPGTKMLAFGTTLTPSQIADVVAFVRAFAKDQPASVPLPAPTGFEPIVLNPRGKDPTFTIRDGRFVGVEQVNAALTARRRLAIIDARPASEWMRVHVAGAVSIPYHDLKRLAEVPDDVWAIAYCACPHHLSGEVVDALIKRGHKRALILDEGINEWHRRGFPVTAAVGVTVPPKETPPPPMPGGGKVPAIP